MSNQIKNHMPLVQLSQSGKSPVAATSTATTAQPTPCGTTGPIST